MKRLLKLQVIPSVAWSPIVGLKKKEIAKSSEAQETTILARVQ
jgi:hypothetical protein